MVSRAALIIYKENRIITSTTVSPDTIQTLAVTFATKLSGGTHRELATTNKHQETAVGVVSDVLDKDFRVSQLEFLH